MRRPIFTMRYFAAENVPYTWFLFPNPNWVPGLSEEVSKVQWRMTRPSQLIAVPWYNFTATPSNWYSSFPIPDKFGITKYQFDAKLGTSSVHTEKPCKTSPTSRWMRYLHQPTYQLCSQGLRPVPASASCNTARTSGNKIVPIFVANDFTNWQKNLRGSFAFVTYSALEGPRHHEGHESPSHAYPRNHHHLHELYPYKHASSPMYSAM